MSSNMFSGNLFNKTYVNYYIDVSKSSYFRSIGVNTFNENSIKSLVENNERSIKIVYPSIKDITYANILALATDWRYFKVDSTSGKYQEKKYSDNISDIVFLLNNWGNTDQPEDDIKTISAIQNSYTGSLIGTMPASSVKAFFGSITNEDGEDVYRFPDEPDVKIEIFFNPLTKRKNNRSISHKAPKYTDISRSPVGTKKNHRATKNLKRDVDRESDVTDNLGTYLPPDDGGVENLNNVVTAPLKMSYNEIEKVWEAGNTQILAKLLTDIEPADIKNVQLELDVINSNELRSSDFYDNDSEYYMGGFTTGAALPLYVQEGNPHAFGPNLQKCATNKIPEKIRVVNRAARSFVKGAVVMCTSIGGEWIIQDFGTNPEDLKPSSTKLQDWAFIKLIATTDEFFSSWHLPEEVSYGNGQTASFPIRITPDYYERLARIKFYTDNNNTSFAGFGYTDEIIKQLNDLNTQFVTDKDKALANAFKPNCDYVVCLSKDQDIFTPASDPIPGRPNSDGTPTEDTIRPEYWGYYSNSNENGSKTNIAAMTGSVQNGSTAAEVPFFWGAIFRDGVIDAKDGLEYHLPAEYYSNTINLSSLYKDGFNGRTIFDDPIRTVGKIPSIHSLQFSPLQDSVVGGMDDYSAVADRYRQYVRVAPRLLEAAITRTKYLQKLAGHSSSIFNPVPPLTVQECETYGPDLNAIIRANKGTEKIKYDCFIDQQLVYDYPLGAPDYFREDGVTTIGANCVGVTGAVAVANKKNGGNIRFSLVENYGVNQRRTVSGQGSSMSIIMGALVGVQTNFIRETGYPQWGTSSNSYYSFGTTALHVRVFDHAEQGTYLYDPRYFSVLHFNPPAIGQYTLSYDCESEICLEKTDDEEGNCLECTKCKEHEKKNEGYSYELVDGKCVEYLDGKENKTQLTSIYDDDSSSVDFQVPTTKDGQIIKIGETFNSESEWTDRTSWIANTVRRGKLLTGDGFYYAKQKAGLSLKEVYLVKAGSGFPDTVEIECAKGVVLQLNKGSVLNDEEVESNEYHKYIIGEEFISFKDPDENQSYNGDGFTPDSFSETINLEGEEFKVYILRVPSVTEDGEDAELAFVYGEIGYTIEHDPAPAEYGSSVASGNKVRLSSLGSGDGFIYESKETEIQVEKNSSGKYHLFFHFHNDITHTFTSPSSFIAGYAQWIFLDII